MTIDTKNIFKKILLKISPSYRRLTHIMNHIQTLEYKIIKSEKQLEAITSQTIEVKNGIDRINHNINSTKKDALSYKDEIKKMITTTIDITHLPKSAGALRDIQDVSYSMLCEIERICNKHKLSYWLDFGTLLGAIRHEGFVPWDDDLDIGMLSVDYEKLLTVIDLELSATDYRFIRVPGQIGKVVHKNFMPKGEKEITDFINWDMKNKIMFALDIAPYYYAKESITTKKLQEFVAKSTEDKDYALFNGGLRYENFEKSEKVVEKLHREISTNEPSSRLYMGLEVLAINIVTKPWILSTDSVFPLNKVKFENSMFPVPRDADSYLIAAYGDYMLLPNNINKHININNMPLSELKKIKKAAKASALIENK